MPTNEIRQQTIKTAILEFAWHNFGLDELEDIDSDEWAEELAADIERALSRTNSNDVSLDPAPGTTRE